MKNNKRWMVAGIIAAAVLLLAGAFAAWFFIFRNDEMMLRTRVYFYNTNTSTLEPETYETGVTSQTDLLNAAVANLFGTPRSVALSRPWPEAEGFLSGYEMNGNILEATFTSAYGQMDAVTEALFRTAFVWTMTELSFVDYVRIYKENVDTGENESVAFLSKETNVINPRNIASARIYTREFTLYFVNENADGLVAVQHISDEVDMDQVEAYIVNQLIAGQNAEGAAEPAAEPVGIYPAIPADVKVISAETDETVCYVNLSDEINKFNGSAALTRLMLYSIVNSLTQNLINVKRVQFQINSETVAEFKGVADFNLPFVMDETLIPVTPE